MRSHQELLREIEVRKTLGLPRIELTQEERTRAFGDSSWKSDRMDYDRYLLERLEQGLPMSIEDRRRAKQYRRAICK